MKRSDTASDFYAQANRAADQGEIELAEKICLDAVGQLEQIGDEQELSKTCHLLGELAFRQSDLERAESWFRKALALDERNGADNTIGHARTCNNLGAIAIAKEDIVAAEQWLRKSIRIKQSLGDDLGVAASRAFNMILSCQNFPNSR